MAARGDQTVKAAVLAVLRRGPRDALGLLDTLRQKTPRLLDRHEGSVHPLLHACVQRGELTLAPLSDRGLARYRLPGEGGADADEPSVPVPIDVRSPAARASSRITSGIRHADDRARVTADVAAHLEALAAAGREPAFGSKRTVRHYLRRADRRRPSVFFAADAGDGVRRFVLHEGPWILGAVIIFLVVRAFLAEVFVIPSGSMVPTLLPGDRVVVYKPGGTSMPERWTIATFERWGTTYVKRAVGLGGELIALVGGDVYIDGAVEVKPDDLRNAFRTPYGVWDFLEDADQWARTTEADTGRVTWTYNGPPLWSAAPLGTRLPHDVRLRDVYATLELELVEDDVVEFDLVYDRPDDRRAREEERFGLVVGTRMLGFAAFTKAPVPAGHTNPATHEPPPSAGRVRLHLSLVDGVARAEVAGSRWESPIRIAPGYVVTPRIRIAGSGTEPLRLLLDKDLHYTPAGDLGHAPDGSDDDPTTYGFRIPEGHVFFLGDNTHNSKDSRYRTDRATARLGPVAVEELIGPVSFRIWPPGRIGGVR